MLTFFLYTPAHFLFTVFVFIALLFYTFFLLVYDNSINNVAKNSVVSGVCISLENQNIVNFLGGGGACLVLNGSLGGGVLSRVLAALRGFVLIFPTVAIFIRRFAYGVPSFCLNRCFIVRSQVLGGWSNVPFGFNFVFYSSCGLFLWALLQFLTYSSTLVEMDSTVVSFGFCSSSLNLFIISYFRLGLHMLVWFIFNILLYYFLQYGNKFLFFFNYEFLFLLLCTALSTLLVILSGSLITLFICLEVGTFCFLLLIVLINQTNLLHSVVLYFIFSGVASLLFLSGCVFLYLCCGQLTLGGVVGSSLMFAFDSSSGSLSGFWNGGVFLILCSLFINLGIFPFFSWLYNVYLELPVLLVLVSSGLQKIGVVWALHMCVQLWFGAPARILLYFISFFFFCYSAYDY